MRGLSVRTADGAGVDVENGAGDVTFGILELVRGVDGFRLPVVTAEDAHPAGIGFLLHLLCARALEPLALTKNLDQVRLCQDVLDRVGCVLDPADIRVSADLWSRLLAQLADVHSTEEAIQFIQICLLAVAREIVPDGVGRVPVQVQAIHLPIHYK